MGREQKGDCTVSPGGQVRMSSTLRSKRKEVSTGRGGAGVRNICALGNVRGYDTSFVNRSLAKSVTFHSKHIL